MKQLLDDTKMIKNITAAQLVKVFFPFVIVKTEDHQYWKLNLSEKESQDPLFWESMKKILQEKIWVPVGRKYHQMLDNGWELSQES
ncbi:hypothetical protein [Lentilactobacillus diolivorans]|uniref:Uncharacterized protein n=2 Tax=Lentilactobacillus diolivorans TaxID=179838 RepID=A0A0R1SQS2_9LACO|nr:hypothetical protein [Lentilactobacillus diolivorans]KRL69050.1 hypothetical protein FC85_GL002269 [Lentilactobacillus diolivorans DSM 14421]GEP22503.1 hypothetical protein LDI01_00960 [Lentilactobacillus diolivorans]